ncbi:MAG: hypothetical protein A2W93_15650 [Bacteroidetes bacterium GWF2_43_63]|nr:MAG: hypothetical protein A2W94_13740 [Bacteroidetes bacterium GWE2_42_42]OFY53173.1 MAG: hypothetical protein A2W93_15650 [Bacteroidetes bacterium GWF2_43_63]
MIIILSPAKTMHVPLTAPALSTVPVFGKEARDICNEVKNLSFSDFSRLLKVSGGLARQAYDTMQQWIWPHDPKIASAAALMYDGPAFKGLNAHDFSRGELEFAQLHLRILSGLYGVLRPYDQILPYRLEAQTPVSVRDQRNLYSFWNSHPAKNIEADLRKLKSNLLINLTSDEYGKMIIPHISANVRIINVAFKEMKAGKPFINVVEMKKARGMMSRFIIQNRITDVESLTAFDLSGYYFERKLSDENNFTFLRG